MYHKLKFEFKTFELISLNKMSTLAELTKHFSHESFRDKQEEIVEDALKKMDQFVILPTGSGKSICFQLPALIDDGVTIVISPLKSLILDQVANLEKNNIQADAFYGDISVGKRREILDMMIDENYDKKMIYTTPETLDSNVEFFENLVLLYNVGRLKRFVIDEAHCISLWGNDFRNSYRKLANLKKRFNKVPLMALTATATPRVRIDTTNLLGIDNCRVYTKSYFRPNLNITVNQKSKEKDMVDEIIRNLSEKYSDMTGIIYCLSRKKCEALAERLQQQGINCDAYHAGQTPKKRADIQHSWQKGETPLIIATIAFGMGIDKEDVRYVIHCNMPFSLENYYQEIGRAGRDGKESDCIMYYSHQDTICAKMMIENSHNDSQNTKYKQHQTDKLFNMLNFCQNIVDCRHCQVSNYLGEMRSYSKDICVGSCDNCKNKSCRIKVNVSDIAKIILESVMRVTSPNRPTKSAVENQFMNHENINKLLLKYGGDKPDKLKSNLLNVYKRLFIHLIIKKYIKESFIKTLSGYWRENYQVFRKSEKILKGTSSIKMIM